MSRRVCYYTNWAQYRTATNEKFLPEDIDPFLCTHLIYSFASMNGNKLVATEWNDENSGATKGMWVLVKIPLWIKSGAQLNLTWPCLVIAFLEHSFQRFLIGLYNFISPKGWVLHCGLIWRHRYLKLWGKSTWSIRIICWVDASGISQSLAKFKLCWKILYTT